MTPWEQWRFDALVEAARRMLWGLTWWKHDGWKHHVLTRGRVAFYLVPSRW